MHHLFTQSRELHKQLRHTYRQQLFGTNVEQPVDDKRVAMMFMMELFHRQVFDALQSNPISGLLSIAWTLSITSRSLLPNMKTKDYLAVWSPMLCLVNSLTQLARKFSDKIDDDDDDNDRTTQPDLFQLDDLRAIDREFFERLTQRASLTPSERDDLVLQQTNSDLFERFLAGTPFGTYQIVDVAAAQSDDPRSWQLQGKRYSYVTNPLDLRDRHRYAIMYERHETAERLRRQVEQRLRIRIAVYHRMYGVYVQPWMMAAHEREANGSYAMLWQVQKSALVWIFYHSLAAIVTMLDEPLLTNDLIATIRSLENFIECGLCYHHWKTVHLKRWDAIQMQHLTFKGTAERPLDIDELLLQTHNDIQTSIDPSIRVTAATAQAIRSDYLNFARCVITAISVRAVPQNLSMIHRDDDDDDDEKKLPLLRNNFHCSVFDQEAKRADVCREPWEVWAMKLKASAAPFDCDAKNRGYVKRSLLQLEWDRTNCR